MKKLIAVILTVLAVAAVTADANAGCRVKKHITYCD